jgi:hypothetical protein
MCAIYSPWRNLLSRSPTGGREDEKPWLFETLTHNLLREPGRRRNFLFFFRRNPLKRLDSEKLMKTNESYFTSV